MIEIMGIAYSRYEFQTSVQMNNPNGQLLTRKGALQNPTEALAILPPLALRPTQLSVPLVHLQICSNPFCFLRHPHCHCGKGTANCPKAVDAQDSTDNNLDWKPLCFKIAKKRHKRRFSSEMCATKCRNKETSAVHH